jgi:hypothetical protein
MHAVARGCASSLAIANSNSALVQVIFFSDIVGNIARNTPKTFDYLSLSNLYLLHLGDTGDHIASSWKHWQETTKYSIMVVQTLQIDRLNPLKNDRSFSLLAHDLF